MHHYTSRNGCTTITKRYLGLAAFLSIIVGAAFLIYSSFWPADNGPKRKFADRDSIIGQNVGSFHSIRDKERAAYNRLMRYVLNPQAPCVTVEMVGGKKDKFHDGDKALCLDPGPKISDDCIAFSFGINNEWSFDEGMRSKYGCQVYSFDPTMGVGSHLHKDGIRFYNWGLGEFNGKIEARGGTWVVRTFGSILGQLGHTNRTIDVLKLDIEGSECLVLEDMLDKGLLKKVNHLCVEIHLKDNPYWEIHLRLLERIEEEAGLRLFSTRNNTTVPKMRVPGFPSRYEQHLFELAWYRH